MKTKKMILLFVALMCVQHYIWGQTRVLIGDLYYSLSGISASVANHTVCPTSYNWSSGYQNDTYTIPSKVSYDNLEYKVTALDKLAFACNTYYYDAMYPGSTATSIILPNTIVSIGDYCFSKCENLVSMIIPASVNMFGVTPFMKCFKLREMIYLPRKSPSNWTATSMTYVPDIQSYSSPSYSINDAHVIEMITFNKTEFEYTGQAPSTTWTNNVAGYEASLSTSALSGEVGNHEEWIPVTFTKGEDSFTAEVVYRYTIKPAKLQVKVNNISREYGDDNPHFSISYSGFVGGDDETSIITEPTVMTTATKTSAVGNYPITVSGGDATNYEFAYEPGVLTITKAPLSAKVNDANRKYGSQNPTFTIEYYGLKNGESAPTWTTKPTFQTEATKTSSVGQYVVEAINGVPKNYEMGDIMSGILSITPAPLTVKANNVTRQYYDDNPVFSYTCSGLMNGEDKSVLYPEPTLTTSATRNSEVGTYEIKVSETSSPNYSISYTNGTLTITQRPLIASVDNYSRNYNEENPIFEVHYDGFVGSEDENMLTTKAIASTTATKNSDVGTYPITISNGSAVNYKLSYLLGTLTINKAEQTIEWGQSLSNLKIGDQVELKASASSGLPITYTLQTDAAEIYTTGNKTYLDCMAAGQFSILAIQEGNKNYFSSPRARSIVNISEGSSDTEPVLTIKQADNGYISTPVPYSSSYSFTVTALDGWKIHSVTFNDEDVTNQLGGDNLYTTPAIKSDSKLIVVYEQDETGISDNVINASPTRIQGTSFGVRVTDAKIGDQIRVYTVDGALQKTVKVANQTTDIPLDKNNIYIVKVDDTTVKLGL